MAHPYSVQFVASSIITLVICAFGLVGNLLCGCVLFSRHMSQTSYIYILQGLTISDTCLLTLSSLRTLDNLGVISLPTDAYTSTIIFFWDWISTSATKYFTVAVAIERFFVITFPLKAHIIMTTERAKITALLIFGFCVGLSLFSYCYVNWIDPDSFHIYVAVVLHFFPFLLVMIFNTLIFLGLRKIGKQSIRKSSTANSKDDDYSITKMLFTIVLVFGICYAFEFTRRVMNFMWKDYMNIYAYYEYTINCLADIFYVLNSSVNFVIYALLGKSFRAVFCKVFGIGGKMEGSKGGSSSSSGVGSTTEGKGTQTEGNNGRALEGKEKDGMASMMSLECDLEEI